MSDGFLGRWSKRKLEVKQGKAVEAEPKPEVPSSLQPAAESTSPTQVSAPAVAVSPSASTFTPAVDPRDEAQAQPPLPTLEDVKALTAESDYTRFAASDVAPEVKNAAMKKLFADPRYNVMDGLDVYIDDYSQPDPIPASMLRQLASAKFLGLFDEEERQEEAARQARDVADNPTVQSVAQSASVPNAVPEPSEHANPDLRLQQDDAAPGEDPGRGIG